MAHGRFYMAGSQITSSVSGWKYWALGFHLIDLDTAAYWPERGELLGYRIDQLSRLLWGLIWLLGVVLFCLILSFVLCHIFIERHRSCDFTVLLEDCRVFERVLNIFAFFSSASIVKNN